MQSEFLSQLSARGYLKQCTLQDELDEYLQNGKSPAMYVGFDCTADSLHVGSLLPIMIMRLWQKCGFTPIIILGGGTTKVGDPSGKDAARLLLEEKDISSNMAGISRVFKRFFNYSGSNKVVIKNNADWLDNIGYVDFLRDYGRHFSVNRMLKFESVARRLHRDQELSFIEFNYILLQSYDFYILSERNDCRIQLGGSDQWGNIVSGMELIRRLSGKQCFGITAPLILDTEGKKMGKTSAGQTVWLDEDKTSVYDYWQYFRNVADTEVMQWLRWFTEIPNDEIASLERRVKNGEINEVKKILAGAATAICHGKEKALEAERKAVNLFESKVISIDDMPELTLDLNLLANDGISLKQVLCSSGAVSSTSEAKRLIRAGGCHLAGKVVNNENMIIALQDFPLSITLGKKRHFRIILQEI